MSVLVFMAYTAYKKSSANTDDTSYYGYSPNWIVHWPGKHIRPPGVHVWCNGLGCDAYAF